MRDSKALPCDETDNTTIEATVNITTALTNAEQTERQANNRNLSQPCGLSRLSLAYRVGAGVAIVLLFILMKVLQPNESAAVNDLRDLIADYVLNLTLHGANG